MGPEDFSPPQKRLSRRLLLYLFLDPASLDPANAVYTTYSMSTMAVVELRSIKPSFGD
ncbi:MAG: hypothetical protein AAGN15_04105 [Cyanobacteria bacterium J06581_3]